ncbi:serine aminopeptidase domain-containing protein [Nonomuraea rubra]|uniref:Alpha-beta hydrolase superfamily lysophospholipase n=1 Tax=Nonomuraea rubra TaxID=46180 RepID=A0A7X0NXE0_9ACTN|nr:alpha/beta hydrolase [Nonomuraea rubra]MBB6551375.1 alpha-beta hydrolase superfamily lysophospholipase [Nonomuraea rubra]
MADRVVVLYRGQVVETGTTEEIFAAPRHPSYTRLLMTSVPSIRDEQPPDPRSAAGLARRSARPRLRLRSMEYDMTQNGDHHAPDGLKTRGTVIVVPGRGETRATYARFGSRLAHDAYRVRVVDLPAAGPAFLDALARRLSEAVAGIAAEYPDGLPRPLVLVGADLGAAGLAALLATAAPTAVWWPQAAVLAGLPGNGSRAGGRWEDELDVRTHCPTHRGDLTGDAAVERGALAGPVPQDLLDTAYASTAGIPRLLLAGDADPLADRDAIARAARTLPRARLAVVRGAHHDVLNDLQHRSVAGGAAPDPGTGRPLRWPPAWRTRGAPACRHCRCRGPGGGR